MKGKILSCLSILLTITLISCSQTLQTVEFTELNSNCVIDVNNDIIIKSIKQVEFWEEKGQCDIPDVNFFNYNVLGKYVSGNGCSADFKRQVFIDEAQKIITYEITPNFNGACEKFIQNNNWILIPNMHEYKIKIEVKE